MSKILAFFKIYLLPLGGVGIFSMTFLDSTFVPMPNIMDLTFIGFCLARREMIPYYCLMATAGSVAGCFVLFTLARRGSDWVRRKMTRSHRMFEIAGRHGAPALLLAALMPPPFPFKVFIFASGMFPIGRLKFFLALTAGRGFRFVFQGAFAYFYGEQVVAYMQQDFARLSIIVAAIIVMMFGLSWAAKRWVFGKQAQ